jgi:hypothetical protein
VQRKAVIARRKTDTSFSLPNLIRYPLGFQSDWVSKSFGTEYQRPAFFARNDQGAQKDFRKGMLKETGHRGK